MVIADAIRQARTLADNEIPNEMLIKWLSDHDGLCWDNVISRYEGPIGQRPSYGPDTDPETELLVPAPYDGMYAHYLAWQIHLAHEDIDRYNNEAAVYQSMRQEWANHYNRTHRWAGTCQRRELRPKYYDTQILF